MVKQGDLLWTPTAERIAGAELTRYMSWLRTQRGLDFADYHALYAWSVRDIAAFWQTVWEYFDIKASQPYTAVLADAHMPGAKWFPGAKLNYAEHILRQARAGEPAAWIASEQRPLAPLPWESLVEDVTRFAARLRDAGVVAGDRVVAFMPNIPEPLVAFLAAASLGAVWSSCSPDFGVRSVLDRFRQIEPKVLVCVDGYFYGGKAFDRTQEVREIVAALPTLQQVVCLQKLGAERPLPVPQAVDWQTLMATPAGAPLAFAQVDFDHPLWVVYSSGTTGLPKAMVHGHGGITLELHKTIAFHCNLRRGTRMFFYTTSGWIMWNILVGSMLVGCAPVLYDGHPSSPEVDVLWRIASESRATMFGASPTYVQMMQKNGVVPRERYDFAHLEGVLLTGSPVTPESMLWMQASVREDLWVSSQSGGTDVSAGFVTGCCTLPVYAGEIQVRGLGVDVQSWNDNGEPVLDEMGELVVTQPMPSMPLHFWNDPGNARYLDSYFAEWPGYWRHGDFFELNARGGCLIKGRSDSTLNRYGIRIGTAEIYRTVETIAGVEDSLIVNLDLPGGRFFMPMFLKLAPGVALDAALISRISQALREQCSPRHVPDKFYAVEAIPYTLTGKKLEVPVRKILMGFDIAKSVSRDAMQNPAAIDWYIEFGRRHEDYDPG